MAEYLVLTVDEQLTIAEQQLRGAEVEHYRDSLASPGTDAARNAAIVEQMERLQAEVTRLRAVRDEQSADDAVT